MKPFKIIIFMLLSTASLFSQQYDNRIAPTLMPLDDVALSILPPLDNDLLLQAELERRGPGIAPRFAEVVPVDISPETNGTWETLSNGNAVWRLRIQSAGAKSLNLGFTQFFMPEGGTLILYTANKKRVMGPFTPADNEEHEQLWTPVLDGDDLVIEVQLPEDSRNDLQLNLTSINHDFIGFNSIMSGSCNLDAICGEADGWEIVEHYRDIIQSVGVLSTGGDTFCTGFLVNNTRNDCTPYFMTANHCIGAGDAPSLVVFWNYVNSFCREPNSGASGAVGNGSLADFNTGSIFRASYGVSDFTLVELDDEVSTTANAFFAGWTADPDFSTVDTLIGVHHPNTEEKRISFDFDTPHMSVYLDEAVNVNADHVRVPDWDVGTTEGGSSGSPLFDNNKRVIGQLHGGYAGCGNDESDWYGAFATSWEGGGTPDSRLKDWLDPDDTGLLTMDGRNQLQCSFFVLAQDPTRTICAPEEAIYTITVSGSFSGPVTLSASNATIEGNISFGANPIMPGTATTLTVSNTDGIVAGTYIIELTGTDGSETSMSSIQLTVFDSSPTATALLEPANEAGDQILNPMFSWADMGAGTSYHFQLSTDTDFTTIVFEASDLIDNNIISTMLLAETNYFWRVTASNICGAGETSSVFSFSTAAISCAEVAAQDLPIVITPDGTPVITSSIEINLPGSIIDVSISNLEILHTYVGDLTATLTSPEGTIITIFVEAQEGACDGDNLSLNFSDAAEETADDYINSCGDNPAIEGNFQPVNLFSTLTGESASGTWTLTVYDDANQDGGELINWELIICTAIPSEAALYANITEFTLCEQEMISFEVLTGIAFDGDVTLSSSGLPTGAVVSFDTNPVVPGATTNVTVTGVSPSGSYDFVITGTDGTSNVDLSISLTINGTPIETTLQVPENGATEQMLTPMFTWDALEAGTTYYFELSTDENFSTIIFEASDVENANITSSLLEGETSYFWRVTTLNSCGEGMVSDVFSFSTAEVTCAQVTAAGLPISISDVGGTTITSTINVDLPGVITNVSIVNLDILHTWVGDLTVFLTSPNGTEIILFTNPGDGDCNGDNLIINLSDAAENTAGDLAAICNDLPAIEGSFQPLDPFSAFNQESPSGAWALSVLDGADNDAGSLVNWELIICTAVPNDAALYTNITEFTFCEQGTVSFDVLAGGGFDGDITLSASGLPVGATVNFDVNPVTPGAMSNVTVTGISPSGSYDLIITANDGTNNADLAVTLNIEGAPGLAALISPPSGEEFGTPSITLIWDGTENTGNYLVEISTTESFDNIIESATVTGLSYISTELEANGGGLYYWRVTATNECGSAITDFSTFTYTPLSVDELNGREIEISPNPTSGDLMVDLSSPVKDVLNIQVFDVNGKLLQTNYIKTGESQTTISLAQYTSGLYLLKLTDGNVHLTKRIILQ